MALPKAIERQAEEAEELRKSVYEGQAVDTTVSQPASDPDADLAPPANVVSLPTPAEPAAVVPPQPDQDAAYWQKRFETVQGKLDAEMPRAFQQIRELSETVKRQAAQLEARATPVVDETLVTQKDVDAFGEDLIDAMRRVGREEARKAYAAERAALDKKFGAVETQVGQVTQRVEQNAVDSFWSEVISLVPDWLSVDQNPSWIAWLDLTPEFASATYRELAHQAISKANPRKVAKLVETWKKETGQASSPTVPTPAPSRQQQSELERQVAPSTVRSNALPAAAKIYTRAEYEMLYDVRNVQRYGDKKAAEMIAEADQAVAENRVRWT